MKLRISVGAVSSFVRLAVTARVVCGIVIDMPGLLSSSWLSILLGGALALPAAFAVGRMREERIGIPRALCAAFFAVSAYDAAVVSSAIADSAGYLALNSTAAVYLMIPHLILCLFCLRLNGDALGSSAGLWNKILPLLLLIVILMQAGDYRPEWLSPLLGPGAGTIIDGALRAAGWFLLPAALCIAAEPEISGSEHTLRPVKTLISCTLVPALIALCFSMMTPAIVDEKLSGRTFRFDALLANGRSGLALQAPAITLWYIGMIYALLFDLFAASLMLQSALPGWTRSGCIWTSVVIVGILSAGSIANRTYSMAAADVLYILQSALLAAAMLYRGGAQHA